MNKRISILIVGMFLMFALVSTVSAADELQIWRNASTNANVSWVDNNGNWFMLGDVDFNGTITGDGSGLTDINTSSLNLTGINFWGKNGDDLFYNDGNVGIGTDSPGAKLEVKSSGSGNQIRIWDTSWPDDSFVGYGIYGAGQTSELASFGYRYNIGGSANSGIQFGKSTGAWMTLLSSGNVGIGTDSPGVELDVVGNIRASSGYTVGIYHLSSTNGLYTTAGNLPIIAANNAGGTGEIIFKTNNAENSTERMRIDSTGNVGIGTTSPASKLNINGSYDISGGLTFGDGDSGIYENGDDYLTFYADGQTEFGVSRAAMGRIFTTGGGQILDDLASSTVPSFTFVGDIDTGIGHAGDDQLSLIAGGVEGLRVETANITSNHDLYVTGGINATGDVCSGDTCLSDVVAGEMNASDSELLDGYDSSFFMPLNTSVVGQFDFNGGWTNDGLSIIDGNIYAQQGYFYQINSLAVSNLEVNGSLIPDLDNQFDVGNSTMRWRDGYFGGDLDVDGTINGDFIGTVNPGFVTGSVVFQNDSGLAEDNSNFFWDYTNKRLGIGTGSPGYTLDVNAGDINIDGGQSYRVNTNQVITQDSTFMKIGFVNAGTYISYVTDDTTRFMADNVEAMRLSATGGLSLGNNYVGIDAGAGNMIMSGNVGIGTSIPSAKLDVNVSNSGASIRLTDTTGDGSGSPLIYSTSHLYLQGTSIQPRSNFYPSTNLAYTLGGSSRRWKQFYSAQITDDGTNVGIGTDSPRSSLEVGNSITGIITSSNTNTVVTTGDVMGEYDFYSYDATHSNGLAGYIRMVASNSQSNDAPWGTMQFGTSYGSAQNATTRMSIGASGKVTMTKNLVVQGTGDSSFVGNVGIGTTSPSSNLEIVDSAGHPILTISNNATNAYDPKLHLLNDGNNGAYFKYDAGIGDAILANTRLSAAADLYLRTQDIDRLTITGLGNVGIGTTSPTQKLDVNGSINVSDSNGKVYAPEICLGEDCRTAWPNVAVAGGWTSNDTDTSTTLDVKIDGDLIVTGSATGNSFFGFFVGTTSSSYNGNLSTGGNIGYVSAHALCAEDYPGSHFCLEVELMKSNIVNDTISNSSQMWISKGAPGYTANANDCEGWTKSSGELGPFWDFSENGGVGAGKLTVCESALPLACCR